MGNLRAKKCGHCKKAFAGANVAQKYCSNSCRTMAYRARKLKAAGKKTNKQNLSGSKPMTPATCAHCSGTFWAKTARAQFCSTSCRSLYHRYLKASLPAAVGAAFGVPADKALDLLELREVGKIREYLACMGYVYQHERRAWVAAG